MSETWAILPVKAFDQAKSRLSSVLAATQCASIARLMATDLLRALTGTPEIDRVLVLGQTAEQERLARRFACDFESDEATLELSANLSRISGKAEIQAAARLLVVAADLPRLRSEDLSRVLRGHEQGVTICRAARDGGTNALIASMPMRLQFCFGADSARRHALAAQAAGHTVKLLDEFAFQRDIDTPDDLRWLCRQNDSGDTAVFLQESGVAMRLEALNASAAAP